VDKIAEADRQRQLDSGSGALAPTAADATGSGVGVVDRSVARIATLAEDGPAALAELVARTGLARPTAYRLAVALEYHGLVSRDENGRFRLGTRVLGWANQALNDRGLAENATTVLAQLRDATDASAQLYVRDHDRRVCLASVEPRRGLRDLVPVGASFPLDRGSGGRILLAWAPDAAHFPRLKAADLAAIRAAGWASTVAEREPGVASVSAPVFDAAGTVIAAVGVSGPEDRFVATAIPDIAARVVAAARALEIRVGLRNA
jgi:DNA-binding IclR family transcriptional regulator